MAPDSVMLLQVLVDSKLKIEDRLRQTCFHWLRTYKYGKRISYQSKTVPDNGQNTSKHRNKGTSKWRVQMGAWHVKTNVLKGNPLAQINIKYA